MFFFIEILLSKIYPEELLASKIGIIELEKINEHFNQKVGIL